MQRPDFLKLNCQNNTSDACASCGREFIIPVSAIEGAYKTVDGNVEIFICSSHFIFDPRCLSQHGDKGNRTIKMSITWDDFIDKLDGELLDCGNINMVQI